MSGREKQKVYVYDIKGKFIERFDSITSFREAYYPNDIGKRPVFTQEELGYEYHINLSAEIIAFTKRPGREKTKLIVAIHQSEYCKATDENELPVQVFNLKGELIAEFKSQRILSKIMPDKASGVSKNLRTKKEKYKMSNPPGGLFFKYKE